VQHTYQSALRVADLLLPDPSQADLVDYHLCFWEKVSLTVAAGSTQSYLDFRFAEHAHSVRVSHAFRQRVSTLSTTAMLHLPEYPDLFLPPDYDFKGQLLSYSVLIAFFLGSAGYSIWMLVKENSNRI
jgi:hypothetical protein